MGVIGESIIEVTINGLAKKVKFVLVEELGFCLVGLPTLKSFKIQINTDEETIICNNTLTNYFKKTGIMGSEVKVNLLSREQCNIHLDSTITIPANKSMLVFANVKHYHYLIDAHNFILVVIVDLAFIILSISCLYEQYE